jgi:lipopolysaccharide/colanic/teichoic acid biosynthesis glycosyltransferase
MQRFFDIVFSGLALLMLSLFFMVIIIVLKFTGEKEVFYIQKRIGKDGKLFGLLKFATMLKDSQNMGSGSITLKDDPRVFPVGKFLRKTKINELPQLFNVLKGDMSVIGPRPLIPSTFYSYPLDIQSRLNKVRPGLSGIGSIVFRDEESILSAIQTDRQEFYRRYILPYKGKLEIWYVEHKSLYVYFSLIFLTIIAIIHPKGKLYEKVLMDLPSNTLSSGI